MEEETFSPEAIKSMYEQIKNKLPINIKSPIKENLKILNVEIMEDGIYGDVDNLEEIPQFIKDIFWIPERVCLKKFKCPHLFEVGDKYCKLCGKKHVMEEK